MKSLLRISEAFVARRVVDTAFRRSTLEAQRATLLSLYGIGPASVGYILIDVFHAFDELARISPWEQRIYSHLFLDTSIGRGLPVGRRVWVRRAPSGRRSSEGTCDRGGNRWRLRAR